MHPAFEQGGPAAHRKHQLIAIGFLAASLV